MRRAAQQLDRSSIDAARADRSRSHSSFGLPGLDLGEVEDVVDDASAATRRRGCTRRRRSSRCSAVSAVSSSSSVMPSTPFIGVRISWLMLAGNWRLTRAAPVSSSVRSCSVRSSLRCASRVTGSRPATLAIQRARRPGQTQRTDHRAGRCRVIDPAHLPRRILTRKARRRRARAAASRPWRVASQGSPTEFRSC